MPLAVTLRCTPFNRTSIAALLAVLERELPGGLITTHLATSLDEVHPGLLAYSFMTPQRLEVQQELALLEARGDVRTVAGGPHPDADPQDTLGLGFDWVIPGEAGPDLARLVAAVAAHDMPPRGVLPRQAPLPLDHYPPWPASGQWFSALEISRGCPHRCTYCQVPALHGNTMRHRSLTSLQSAFRHAVETGHSFTRFVSPNSFAFGAPNGQGCDWRALERLLLGARDCGLQRLYLGSFPSEVRPESVTDEVLQVVRDLCANRGIVVGLQSGSDRVLRNINRGHTVAQGMRAITRIARAGFTPRVDFIFGLPDETADDRSQTRALMRELSLEYGARINAHLFTPLPGTRLAGSRPAALNAATLRLLEQLEGRGHCRALRRLSGQCSARR